MRVMLCQLDGKLPNLALMRLSKHHRERGDEVDYRFGADFDTPPLFPPDRVYASAIFRKSILLAERLKARYPSAVIGGTGVDPARKGELVPLSTAVNTSVLTLEKTVGISAGEAAGDFDYSMFPAYTASMGFTQRGCRKHCSFCAVPTKEPKLIGVNSVWNIWRGHGYPRHLHLLDNDFFGGPEWQERIAEMRDGKFKVSFNQGINARFLTDEAAEAIASVDYRADDMKVKRIYTAWDNLSDEDTLMAGLNRLVKYGVKPDHIMVYILIGYWPNDQTPTRWNLRRERLREFGARPYPMPFTRTREQVGFQRWVIGAYDKPSAQWPSGIPWEIWEANNYRPEGLSRTA
ncbi:radical SAM protein [Acidobacteria bacterium AB60]|nr:radical SAM protein [Acidobacteria bacterium AB60]